MDTYVPAIALIAVLFCAMILQLAAKPRFAAQLTGILIVIAAIAGFIFYGYGYAVTLNDIPLAVLRGLLGVCGMFVGKVDASAVSATPLFQYPIAQYAFWLAHLFALYATASATIATIGAEALRKLRLWLARRGNLCLIYGANQDSLDFARSLQSQDRCSIVFIDSQANSGYASEIAKIGCVLRSDKNALQADRRFLRSIGIRQGKRKISLYALSHDNARNLDYAVKLLESLKEADIHPEQTSLVLPGAEDALAAQLQILGDHYGYGYVTVFQKADLAARLLIQHCPPCDTITFTEDCRAQEDFHALIVGFGQLGQAVMRQLVMHGQFEGSKFRCAVFSPDCQNVNGLLENSCKEMLDNYDITLYSCDARSSQMYNYLKKNAHTLKYIAVCAGSAKNSSEIAEDLTLYCRRMSLSIPVHQCGYSGVTRYNGTDLVPTQWKLYSPQMLHYAHTDRMAMVLNNYYQGTSEFTPVQDWMRCDYFSRMSSRASADFIPAALRAMGKSEQEILESGLTLTPQQLENLAKTEHHRWCAFHYCMGFSLMTDEEFDSRTAQYLHENQECGSSRLRIGKNMLTRTHACLILWDALDALSDKESRITGKPVDYKLLDRQNILAIPNVLRAKMNWGTSYEE